MNSPSRRASSRELLLAGGIVAIAIAFLPLVGASVLWTRPLWMDELCTVFVASHATVVGMIANIAEGGDWAPPLLHLIIWSARRVAGSITPVLLRSISLACVSLALLFVYATLRRRLGRAASAAGTLSLLGLPLLIAHAFEGRPYGPWLLFAAGFAWSLGIDGDQARSRRRDIALAVFSISLCTIHWFGVLSLALMAMAAAATPPPGRRWRDGLRLIAPSAAGIIVLLVCVPLVFTQRAAASGLLWVRDLDVAQVLGMMRLFWLTIPPILAVILLLREGTRPDGAWPAVKSSARAAANDPSMAALGSLALMPVVLMIISVVLQPSMVDRYGIVAVLAWAPIVALAVESLPGEGRAAMTALLIVAMGVAVTKTVEQKQQYAELMHANQAVYERAKEMNLPIVFQYMHLIYPVAGPERSAQTLARFLDIPDSTLKTLYPSDRVEWLRRQFRLERSQARLHAKIYGFPILATQAELDATPRFLLLATDLMLPGGYKQAEKWGRAVFPNHRVVRLNDVLSLFDKTNYPVRVVGAPRPGQ